MRSTRIREISRSGSVRQLNSEITASRNVRFMAFALVRAEGVDFKDSRKEQFLWLSGLGSETVEFVEVTAETLSDAVRGFAEKIRSITISRRMVLYCFMMISPMDSRLGGRRNSRGIPSLSNGRT